MAIEVPETTKECDSIHWKLSILGREESFFGHYAASGKLLSIFMEECESRRLECGEFASNGISPLEHSYHQVLPDW